MVFTAGIGEHSPEVRTATCDKLRFMGVQLDPHNNAASPPDQQISAHDSKVRVLIIRAQEDWAIAKNCARLCRGGC